MILWIDVKNRAEPAWSLKIDRWYQLDEVAFAFCEALHQWNYLKDIARPEVIFLALPGASNLADFDFANGGATSPSKFVYTLPNICASVIFQLLGHNGKIFCVTQGDSTLEFARAEAAAAADAGHIAWVFSSTPELNENRRQVIFESFIG
ncbi:MAG: hypothetical protein H7326_09130 [Bdellovibrionaceae bacterium]|nr:hypothetical protein [Pseudobdellovibrionaceae bacterium]